MLSDHQIKIIQSFMPPACELLMKLNHLSCSVTATRVVFDVLKKHHFKVDPLVVQAKVYNPVFASKQRPPENEEEAKAWFEEGCWAYPLGNMVQTHPDRWPGHLVAIINDVCIMDLAVVQAYRPDKNMIVNPVFAEINSDFVNGNIPRGVVNNECLIVYEATPEEKSYLKTKEWIDKKSVSKLESEVITEMRRKPTFMVERNDSSVLKQAKKYEWMDMTTLFTKESELPEALKDIVPQVVSSVS